MTGVVLGLRAFDGEPSVQLEPDDFQHVPLMVRKTCVL